jgi:signal recognition particle receptor subunit alpha
VLQVAYQRILQLTYAEDLLTALKNVFVSLYEPFLTALVTSLHAKSWTSPSSATPVNSIQGSGPFTWDFAKVFSGWDKTFDKVLKLVEDKVAAERKSRLRSVPKQSVIQPSPPSSDDSQHSGFHLPFSVSLTLSLT